MFPLIHLRAQAAQLSLGLAFLAVPTACRCLPVPTPGEAHCPQSLEIHAVPEICFYPHRVGSSL